MDNELSEEVLIQQIQSGDRSALGTLVFRYQTSLLNTAFRILGNQERAEEVTQQTFVKVLQHIKKYRPTATFKTWLYTILINLCRDHFRNQTRHPLVPLASYNSSDTETPFVLDPPDPSHNPPEEILEEKERTQTVQEALSYLPQNQREALALKEFEGMSYREIAQVLGTSEKAVDSLIFRARENLRKRLSFYFKSEGF